MNNHGDQEEDNCEATTCNTFWNWAQNSCAASLEGIVEEVNPEQVCVEPHHTDFIDTSMSTPESKNNNQKPKQALAVVGQWAGMAGQAVQQWTVKKYALPDKTVASQVLMYRQLLHTGCRPGLKLSREYQGTPAQVSVKHMPWWSKEVGPDGKLLGMEETGKMVISYNNLIRRLWAVGAMREIPGSEHFESSFLNASTAGDSKKKDALPPIPHEYWVSRLGFQQPDPVTDFRSGGILSLAMMVWIVESCPSVYARYCREIPGSDQEAGDASVLPFGITSINVTDMMAKFLMLSRSTDRMDALLSQKPFWSMFSDPNALLACQELALDMLADVVQEIVAVRREEAILAGTDPLEAKVTVFDFSHILSVTEKRVELDLLGAGPVSVKELRMIHKKLQTKYQQKLENKLERIREEQQGLTPQEQRLQQQQKVKEQVLKHANGIGAAATDLAGNVFAKIKSTSFREEQSEAVPTSMTATESTPPAPLPSDNVPSPTVDTAATAVSATESNPTAQAIAVDLLNDDEWTADGMKGATDQVSNFSIGGDDDDEDLLL